MNARKSTTALPPSPKPSGAATRRPTEPRRSSPVVSAEDQEKVKNDPDFVLLRHCEYSLARVVSRYPEGVPHKVIAKALGVTEDEVAQILQKALSKMRGYMT